MQRNAKQDDSCPHEGIPRLICERKHQQHHRRDNEKSRQHRVAPNAVGSPCIGLPVAEDEDCAGSQGIEEPLAEDGQRKKCLKSTNSEQQQGTQDSLQDQRRRWRLKPWMNMRELLEK